MLNMPRGEDYKGKKVVVLGMGNSAVDAATVRLTATLERMPVADGL